MALNETVLYAEIFQDAYSQLLPGSLYDLVKTRNFLAKLESRIVSSISSLFPITRKLHTASLFWLYTEF